MGKEGKPSWIYANDQQRAEKEQGAGGRVRLLSEFWMHNLCYNNNNNNKCKQKKTLKNTMQKQFKPMQMLDFWTNRTIVVPIKFLARKFAEIFVKGLSTLLSLNSYTVLLFLLFLMALLLLLPTDWN